MTYVNAPGLKSVAGGTVAVVLVVQPLQPLHLLHYLHRVLLNQGLNNIQIRLHYPSQSGPEQYIIRFNRCICPTISTTIFSIRA